MRPIPHPIIGMSNNQGNIAMSHNEAPATRRKPSIFIPAILHYQQDIVKHL